MKKLWHLIFIFILGLNANAQSSLIGKVSDANTGEEFIGAKIEVIKKDSLLQKTSTDFEGNYEIILSPGEYQVLCKYIGYNSKQIQSVPIVADTTTILNIEFSEEGPSDVILFSEYAPPPPPSKRRGCCTISAEDIRNLPTKDIKRLNQVAKEQAAKEKVVKDTTSQH